MFFLSLLRLGVGSGCIGLCRCAEVYRREKKEERREEERGQVEKSREEKAEEEGWGQERDREKVVGDCGEKGRKLKGEWQEKDSRKWRWGRRGGISKRRRMKINFTIKYDTNIACGRFKHLSLKYIAR